MLWIIYTTISLFARAFGSIVHKVMARDFKVSGETLSFLFLGPSFLLALLLIPFFSFDLSTLNTNADWIKIFFMAATQGIGMIFYFKALKGLSSSSAQIIFSSIILFSAGLGYMFLGTDLSFLNYLGIFIILAAIVIISTDNIKLSKSGIILMLIAAFLFATYQVLSVDIIKKLSVTMYLMITYLGALICVFLYSPNKIISEITNFRDKKYLIKVSVLSGITSVGNISFAYLGYNVAPEPLKVALLLTTQVVVTVILGYFFLKEKDKFYLKLLAAFLIIVAAYLIKL